MAGNGTAPSGALATRSFAIEYDDGPTMDYRFVSTTELQWRKDGPATGARRATTRGR
jgi:hypothetical protein